MARIRAWWCAVEGLWRAVTTGPPAVAQRQGLTGSCGALRARYAARMPWLTAKDPPKRAFYAICDFRVVRNGVRDWRAGEEGPAKGQGSPRCLSSQRSSRLLMNELRGFPDFPAVPAALALPAAEPRMVA